MDINLVNTSQETQPVNLPGNQGMPNTKDIKHTDNQNMTKAAQFNIKDNLYLAGTNNNNNSNNKINQNSDKKESNANYKSLADALQKIIDDKNNYIQFVKDNESDTMVMKIINSKTKEVVRQIPPEVSLKIARYVESLYNNVKVTNFKA